MTAPSNESSPKSPSEPTVDLFIKTFPADHQWLPYLFRSITKFCRGFRQVILVAEGSKDVLSAQLEGALRTSIPVKAFFIKEIEEDPEYKKAGRVGLGYQHQKAIKLMWPGFTDADAVVQVDSDMVFNRPTTPDSFRTDDGDPVWLRKEWADSRADEWKMWGRGVEWFSRGQPAIWNYMIRPGFYLTREATNAFSAYLNRELALKDPIELFTSLSIPHLSVYNTFGLFLHHFASRFPFSGAQTEDQRHHFGYRLLTAEEFNKPCPLLQYWSWGGIKPEHRAQIERILES